jgi:hypothetical protein
MWTKKFLFFKISRLAGRPTQPPIQRVLGFFFLAVNQPGHEVHHSPPSHAEVKNEWSNAMPLLLLLALMV